MKHFRIATVALLSVCSIAQAESRAYEFTDTATVISSRPIYERTSHPRKECYDEEVIERPSSNYESRRGERDMSGTIIGGIAGGLLGSQVGKGNGKTAAAAVGAVTGAVVGDRIANDGGREDSYESRQPRTRIVQRCREVEDEREEIRGYDVKYKFNGIVRTIRMNHNPGSKLRVLVTVQEDR